MSAFNGGFYITEGIIRVDELGQTFVSSIKTGRRRIIRLDELSSRVRRSSRTTEA